MPRTAVTLLLELALFGNASRNSAYTCTTFSWLTWAAISGRNASRRTRRRTAEAKRSSADRPGPGLRRRRSSSNSPLTSSRHEAEVQRLSQEGLSKREITNRAGISRASVRRLLGERSP